MKPELRADGDRMATSCRRLPIAACSAAADRAAAEPPAAQPHRG